jgi:hypothetical protein
MAMQKKNWISRAVCALGLVGMAAVAVADPVVVVGAPSAAALTKEQVSEVFLGKNTTLTPLDLPESAAQRADFYKGATGRHTVAQVKAVWSRLVFSGKGEPPKELPDAAAVKKAVAGDPKKVGYIARSAVDGTVKVLYTVE